MDQTQRGNVFFYIFLAIALFAGLTMALSQGGRVSGDNLTREQTRLRATEIIDYSDSIAKAVAMMRLRGTTLDTLRFSDPQLSSVDYGNPSVGDPGNMVFRTEGGSIVYRTPSAEILQTPGEQYAFLSRNVVDGIGTTCGTPVCSEVLMALRDLRREVCVAINTLAGIANPSGAPPSDGLFYFAEKFSGAMAVAPAQLGDEPDSAGLKGKPYGCFKNDDDDKFYFYRVLWPQ